MIQKENLMELYKLNFESRFLNHSSWQFDINLDILHFFLENILNIPLYHHVLLCIQDINMGDW